MALLLSGGSAFADSDHGNYRDYPRMVEGVTAQLREYMAAHPERTVDSLKNNVLVTLTDGPIGSRKLLKPASGKRLSAEQLYDKARRSSLVFGKMEHAPHLGVDSAYSNASAVALTPGGICATNYHVVADLVLQGGLNLHPENDRMRFVMDCDGYAYPVTAVLAVDPLNDWAIIKVDPRDKPLTAAPVGGDMHPGARVYCLANPSGAYFHFTDGIVSNLTSSLDKRTSRTKYITEITADYGVGASGGPIFDECGNLVALVSSTFSLYAQPQQFRNFQMSYKQTVPVFLITDRFNL